MEEPQVLDENVVAPKEGEAATEESNKIASPELSAAAVILARHAEALMEGGDFVQDDIQKVMAIMQKLDELETKEKEALSKESAFSRLLDIAEGLTNSQIKEKLIKVIEETKQKVYKEITKIHKDSLLTDDQLTLQQALENKLKNVESQHSAIFFEGFISFSTWEDINEFLEATIGTNLETLKESQLWNGSDAVVAVQDIPGLQISVYDRKAGGGGMQGVALDIDIYMNITNDNPDPKPMEAAIQQTFDEEQASLAEKPQRFKTHPDSQA